MGTHQLRRPDPVIRILDIFGPPCVRCPPHSGLPGVIFHDKTQADLAFASFPTRLAVLGCAPLK